MNGGLDGAVGGNPAVAGPLIGGGVTQAVSLVTKMLARKKSPKLAKWAPTIGLVVGGGLSGLLAARRGTRETGIAGLLTAALIAIPAQAEVLLGVSGPMAGYLGIITPEDGSIQGFGEPAVELLDSGGGGMGALGVTTAEQEIAGFGAGVGGEVELLGAGFGSNFLS